MKKTKLKTYFRTMKGYEEIPICNSSKRFVIKCKKAHFQTESNFLKFLSFEAAKFYYENRYAAYEECKQPCGSMNVYTSIKYKILDTKDPSVTIIFPRYITITNEKFVHSFITLGKMIKVVNYYFPPKGFYIFSCRTGWLSWHDPRIQSSSVRKCF